MAEVFTVHHGLTYRAELQLSFFESMASNDMVAEKFHELGFRHITVSGEGDQRWAQGTWDGPDESVPLTDEHVISVVEVKAPKAAMQAPSAHKKGMGMVEGDNIGHHPGDPLGAPEAPSEEVQPTPAIDPYTGPGEMPEYGPDTGIVPPYLRDKIKDEKLGLKYNPFNPAYPDANANNNVG